MIKINRLNMTKLFFLPFPTGEIMLSKFFDLGVEAIDVRSILHEWRDELSGYNIRLEENSIKISKDRYDPYLSLHYYKLQTLKKIAEDYNATGLLIPLKSSFRLKPISI